ncbi:hypothetical protein C1631_022780 [Chryseobacterium phosphatilyticum]|uniref:Uncharacterized protein n=1 Tax=Chryseobacterium phosphatilyticum TaxID=475075 RepID=A0A316WPS4_9FLAO|nr:hypothetical protein [Chryseobacterium phosphatilyticum]PWN62393.1 hypothetical protein C1631_022780 [Chryseobacterium phosphatilyticum]
METKNEKSGFELNSVNWLKTIEFIQQKQASNCTLISEEENILISYETLKSMIISLHGTKGRLLGLPSLEATNSFQLFEINDSEVKSLRINPHFIIEFNTRLEVLGATKKFNEELKLKNFSTDINLQTISTYENTNEWNEFLSMIDFYLPGIILKYYPNIPFKNYVTT